DKPTSGVLLFTLDKESAKLMSEQFKARETKKTYIAVVRGYTEDSGVIEHSLVEKLDKIADKNVNKDKEAQEATTEYERLATVEVDFAVGKYEKTRYSLVKLLPKTGRKHQLRRHMKHISHHILGDTKYGRGEHNKFIRETYDCHRLLLHATELQIKHPYTGDILNIKAPLDDTFKSMFNYFSWRDKTIQTL
ncbi:MAG: pseudouridylate synthase, partial [Sulfurimonas sp.]|nr:pseudouridylate synthase [Sulfurimonas sp.]